MHFIDRLGFGWCCWNVMVESFQLNYHSPESSSGSGDALHYHECQCCQTKHSSNHITHILSYLWLSYLFSMLLLSFNNINNNNQYHHHQHFLLYLSFNLLLFQWLWSTTCLVDPLTTIVDQPSHSQNNQANEYHNEDDCASWYISLHSRLLVCRIVEVHHLRLLWPNVPRHSPSCLIRSPPVRIVKVQV